ncbi:hypothetical protein ACFE04_030899 [Oxalis oulophora]
MQSIRNSILRHVKVRVSTENWLWNGIGNTLKRQMCATTSVSLDFASPDEVTNRVLELVKKFDNIDSSKVTLIADFQKDLNLDSLDRVELVMTFEIEFSIEIREEKADNLTCCADVAKYIFDMKSKESKGLDVKFCNFRLPAVFVRMPLPTDLREVENEDQQENLHTHLPQLLNKSICSCL